MPVPVTVPVVAQALVLVRVQDPSLAAPQVRGGARAPVDAMAASSRFLRCPLLYYAQAAFLTSLVGWKSRMSMTVRWFCV